MDPLGKSALIVEIPEAEAAVAEHRAGMDIAARLGVPAHVTILFPFVPAAELDERVVARVRELVGSVPPFETDLVRTAWFGEDVLWLAPDPDQPFTDLTRVVYGSFPQYPPYEGQFGDEVTPHLTVADRAPLPQMRAAEQAVRQHLPIHAAVEQVTLIVQPPGSTQWTRSTMLPLHG